MRKRHMECLLGSKLRGTQYEHMFSASPSAPDIARRSRHFAFGPLPDVSNRSTAASAALDQGQEQGPRIADARVLTRRVRLHPVRLPALGQLLQNLLKHLGRIVLTTLTTARSSAFGLQHFDGH